MYLCDVSLSQENQVLIQSYVTLELLHELDQNHFFQSEYFQDLNFEDEWVKQSLSAIGMGNRGMVLISLYTLLVIPKELLQETYPDEFERLNEYLDGVKVSALSTYKSDRDKIDFVKHIRNAVAHSRVEFITKETVTFQDEYKGQKCSIVLPLDTFGDFILELQKLFRRHVETLRKK